MTSKSRSVLKTQIGTICVKNIGHTRQLPSIYNRIRVFVHFNGEARIFFGLVHRRRIMINKKVNVVLGLHVDFFDERKRALWRGHFRRIYHSDEFVE